MTVRIPPGISTLGRSMSLRRTGRPGQPDTEASPAASRPYGEGASMRRRWVSAGLAVLLAVAAAVLPNDSLAQGCSPRPNVRMSVIRVADGRLTVVVSAGA